MVMGSRKYVLASKLSLSMTSLNTSWKSLRTVSMCSCAATRCTWPYDFARASAPVLRHMALKHEQVVIVPGKPVMYPSSDVDGTTGHKSARSHDVVENNDVAPRPNDSSHHQLVPAPLTALHKQLRTLGCSLSDC